MKGVKESFGSFINTNNYKKKRTFTFRVQRKSTPLQRTALTDYIKETLPDIALMKIFIKRTKYELYEGIQNTVDLSMIINKELKRMPSVSFKLKW